MVQNLNAVTQHAVVKKLKGDYKACCGGPKVERRSHSML